VDKELLKQGQKRLSKQRNNRLWWEIVTLIAVIVLAGTMYKLTYSAAAYAPDSTEGGVQETNYAAEDEPDLGKVNFEIDLFDCYTKGFLGECGSLLTENEKKMLPVGAMMMTFECGMRFLTDHLNGDTYFKIHRENHNLDRCRTQFKLVKDMEAARELMDKVVKKYS